MGPVSTSEPGLALQVWAQSNQALEHALFSITRGMAAECVAADLRGAVNALGEIIGATTTDDILDRIFKEFCIGK